MSLAGCALERMYAGPPRPPDQTALVVTSAAELAQIDAIDDTKVSSTADRYEILPGWHSLRVHRPATGGAAARGVERTSLLLDAEPGHTYQLRGGELATGGQWTPRIDDAGPADRRGPTASPPDLVRACRTGRAEACTDLGALYERGTLELEWDEAHAATLYERACAARQTAGCFNLARLYESGHGVDRDERFAAELFRNACVSGEPRACTHLGRLLEDGRGQPKDGRGALELFEKACAASEPAACSRLGFIAREREGPGGRVDYARAAAMYEKACALDEPQGCTGLGNMYEHGLGVEQDEVRAAALYDKACKGGSALGCADLAVLHHLGLGGITQDLRRAIELYRKACARGAATACASLATLSPQSLSPRDRLTYELVPPPAPPQPPAPEPSPQAEAARKPRDSCPEYTVTGTHVRKRVCPDDPVPASGQPSAAGPGAPTPPLLKDFRLGVRGEVNLFLSGFVGGISAELGDWVAAVVTLILRRSPGYRVEGRLYPVQWAPLRLYVALGSSAFFPTVSGRAALGVDVRIFQVYVFSDLALEHFFNAGPADEPDYALLSFGAGWRF